MEAISLQPDRAQLWSNTSSYHEFLQLDTDEVPATGLHWNKLWLLTVIAATGAGNLLVCTAVCRERALQNMANYFLLSLAIADLLVSVTVMPVAMTVLLFGVYIIVLTLYRHINIALMSHIGLYLKQDNVQTNTQSVQCILMAYSISP